jgi:hypothetical protein
MEKKVIIIRGEHFTTMSTRMRQLEAARFVEAAIGPMSRWSRFKAWMRRALRGTR